MIYYLVITRKYTRSFVIERKVKPILKSMLQDKTVGNDGTIVFNLFVFPSWYETQN